MEQLTYLCTVCCAAGLELGATSFPSATRPMCALRACEEPSSQPLALRYPESHWLQVDSPRNGSNPMCARASHFLLDIIIISSQQLDASSPLPRRAGGEAVQAVLIQISQIQAARFLQLRLSNA